MTRGYLICPWCGAQKGTAVVDTRGGTGQVYRRRQCHACGKRFSTYESIRANERLVEHARGRDTPFDPDRVTGAIQDACAKLPLPRRDVAARIDVALDQLRRPTMTTADIRQAITEALDDLHPVAAVRYAALDCRDVADLMTILADRYMGEAKGVPA